eukprot:COSAG03_NODE_717_length_6119_cov_44.906645_1_plen_230_part_00
MLLLRRLGPSCRTAEAAVRHAAPRRSLSAAATAHRDATQGAPHTISAPALAKRGGGAAEAEAGVDAFCWQAARGLAAALPPPALLRAAVAPGAAAEGGAPAAALRAIDAWLEAAQRQTEADSARHRGLAGVGEPAAAAVAAVGVDRSSGDAGQASGCQGWRAGQEPALAERTEGMQMSSVLKKRRAKIKKHWCGAPVLHTPTPPGLAGGLEKWHGEGGGGGGGASAPAY